jgi:uncharacterized protein YkwD
MGGATVIRALTCSACLGTLLAVAPGASAQSAPEILRSDFLRPVKVDRASTLQVRAVDRRAPVGGVLVAFGGGEGLFGLSACRATSTGRGVGAPFTAGDGVRFRIPHTFRSRGARPVLLKLDSGGCKGGGGTTFQTLTVTPTRVGEPSQPVQRGTPLQVIGAPGVPGTEPAPVEIPGLPDLPGVPEAPGGLPELPGVPGIPGLPGIPDPGLPDPPELPPVPPLPTPQLPDPQLPLPKAARSSARGKAGGDAAARAAGSACGPSATRQPGRRTLAKARFATLCLLNRERATHRMRPLRSNRALRRASLRHSRAMVSRGFFAHTQPGGLDFVTRLRRVRYITPRVSWMVGENIGIGTFSSSSPVSMVRAWMNSTPHRANILNRRFREVGLGIDLGVPRGSRRSGATYTTDFGLRR